MNSRHLPEPAFSSTSTPDCVLSHPTDRWIRLIRRAWWFPTGLALTGLAVAWVWTFRQPPRFTSSGRMMVNVRITLPEGSLYTEELGNFMGTQAALMRSPSVLQRARARVMAATGQEPKLLEPPLRVAIAPKTTLFLLSVTGTEPAATRLFLQACVEEYLALKKEMRTETSDSTLAGLTEELLKLERELRRAESALADFQGTNSPLLLQEHGSGASSFLASLHQRRATLEWELGLLTASESWPTPLSVGSELEDLSSSPVMAEPHTPLGVANDHLRLRQQLELLRSDEAELARALRPQHPRMLALREDIARRERMLGILERDQQQERAARRRTLELQVEQLTAGIAEWEERTAAANRTTAELSRLRSGVQRIQSLYDRLLATLQTLDVNKEISPDSVAVAEEASEAVPEPPRHWRNGLAGAAAGLMAGLAILGFVARMDDRLYASLDCQARFEEPLLAQIPWQPCAGPDQAVALISPAESHHAFLEAFRSLRSSLLCLRHPPEPPRTLLVTSSEAGEGKSLVAANLAIALAQAGLKVLLVDADCRKGSLAERFSLPPQPGLGEVLQGRIGWRKGLVATSCENLTLLPRGQAPSPDDSFLGKLETRLLREASAEFNITVLDSPPVLAADDATTMAPLVDGVLFVLRAGRTSTRVAEAALGSLYQRQSQVLGLVFNGVLPGQSGYLQYHRYLHYALPGRPCCEAPEPPVHATRSPSSDGSA